jgi:VanZ family protein
LAPYVWGLFLLLVTIGSLLPQNNPAVMHKGGDKLIHFLAYFFLATYPALAIKPWYKGLALALSMIIWGFLLEIAQIAFPARMFSWADLAANAAGVACGALIGLNMRSKWFSIRV